MIVSLSTLMMRYLLAATERLTCLGSTEPLGKLNKVLKGMRIAQRIPADGFLHGYPHKQFLHGYFKLFTAQGAWDLWNCQYLIWHMMRRDIRTQLLLYSFLEVFIQLHAISQNNEERHVIFAA